MDSAGEDFPHLRSLNIGRTTTKSQEALDEVRQFQYFVSIQLHGIACAEIISNVVKFYLLLASYVFIDVRTTAWTQLIHFFVNEKQRFICNLIVLI